MTTLNETITSRSCRLSKEGLEIIVNFYAESDDPYQVINNLSYKVGQRHPRYSNTFVNEIIVEPRADTHNQCLVTIRYAPREKGGIENEFGETWSWGLNSQQVHILNVIDEAHQDNYGADVGTAINVDGDSINGVDVYRPALSLKVTQRVTESQLLNKIGKIASKIGTTNDSVWKGFYKDCVLFTGANVNKVLEDEWLIEYEFLIGNYRETGEIILSDGTNIGSFIIAPWVVCWQQHEQVVDVETKERKFLLKSIHFAKVYESASFDDFNLRGFV